MTVVSDVFEVLARAEAAGLGLPGLSILVVSHPVGARPAAELVAEGAALGSDAVAALTRGGS